MWSETVRVVSFTTLTQLRKSDDCLPGFRNCSGFTERMYLRVCFHKPENLNERNCQFAIQGKPCILLGPSASNHWAVSFLKRTSTGFSISATDFRALQITEDFAFTHSVDNLAVRVSLSDKMEVAVQQKPTRDNVPLSCNACRNESQSRSGIPKGRGRPATKHTCDRGCVHSANGSHV